MTMTTHQLVSLLKARVSTDGCPVVQLPDGRRGIFAGADREDGSGRCFNVRVSVPKVKSPVEIREVVTVFVRTVD